MCTTSRIWTSHFVDARSLLAALCDQGSCRLRTRCDSLSRFYDSESRQGCYALLLVRMRALQIAPINKLARARTGVHASSTDDAAIEVLVSMNVGAVSNRVTGSAVGFLQAGKKPDELFNAPWAMLVS
jgi:hypothetical protein